MSVLLPEHRERAFGLGEEWQRVGGLYLPPSLTPDLPLAMDLFAGAGGFSCGLHVAGFHVIAASEWWPVAVETYLCNLGSPSTIVHVGTRAAPDATKKERRLFAEYGGEAIPAGVLFPRVEADGHEFGPGTGWIASTSSAGDHELDREITPPHRMPCEHLWMCDVYDLTGAEILEVLELGLGDLDLVVGGPPCQGFSRANAKASKDDPRNLLVFEFARLVCELKPKAMAMENVPGMASMVTAEGIPILDALASVLEAGDFGAYDALRRSLHETAGLGAALRGGKARTEEQEPEPTEDVPEQLVLE